MTDFDPSSLIPAVRASNLLGALKVGAHILTTLFVYAMIARQSGSRTLGAWVMLQLIVGYGGLVHLGMAPVIVKEIAESNDRRDTNTTASPLGEALTGALMISLILFAAIALLSDPILKIIQLGIDRPVSAMCIWMVAAGVVFRLVSALYGATLTGRNLNHLVHVAQLIQIIAFAAAFLLLYSENDIMRVLSMAFVFGHSVEALSVIVLVSCVHIDYLKVLPTLSILRLHRFKNKVLPYLFLDAALMGREPLLKYAIFISSGPGGVGLFELAIKVPAAIRQVFILGLNALMPAFVHLAGRGLTTGIVQLAQHSLRYIAWGAVGMLFLYGLNAEHLLGIWLHEVDKDLVFMTKIMTVWWILTALNVPAWWIGIGLDSGWTNTLIAGAHLAFTLLLVCQSIWLKLSSVTLIIVWLLGGMAMQVLLYVSIEVKTKLIKKIYLSKDSLATLIVVASAAGVTTVLHELVLPTLVTDNMSAWGSAFFFYIILMPFAYTARSGSAYSR
jgi:O-antigen/teichoic acid export membrane protein